MKKNKAIVMMTMQGGSIQHIEVDNRFADADVYVVYIDKNDFTEDEEKIIYKDGSEVQVTKNNGCQITQADWRKLNYKADWVEINCKEKKNDKNNPCDYLSEDIKFILDNTYKLTEGEKEAIADEGYSQFNHISYSEINEEIVRIIEESAAKLNITLLKIEE